MPQFKWAEHPEIADRVRAMWAAGNSAASIAQNIGFGLTKNSIVGFVHRQRLGVSVYRTKDVRIKPPVVLANLKAPRPVPLTAPTDAPEPVIPPETFAGVKQCVNMTGDPCKPGWQMCGNPVKEKKKYCEYHWFKNVDHDATRRAAKG